MASSLKAPHSNPEPTPRDYPLANVLPDHINRSHRRLDILNVIQGALLFVAIVLAIIALLL